MKEKNINAHAATATIKNPDNTILTTIIRPRNILIVIGIMAIVILSFYLFT